MFPPVGGCGPPMGCLSPWTTASQPWACCPCPWPGWGWRGRGAAVLCSAACGEHLFSLELLCLFHYCCFFFVVVPEHSPFGWDKGCDILKILDTVMNSLSLIHAFISFSGKQPILSPFFSYVMLSVAFLSVLVTLSDPLSACAALSSRKLIISICLGADCPFILCNNIFHCSCE